LTVLITDASLFALHRLFSLPIRRTPIPPLFPYTTLFRSHLGLARRPARRRAHASRPIPSVPHGRRPVCLGGPSRRCAHCIPSRRSEEHTSELQSRRDLVCRLLLEKKKKTLTTKELSNASI